MKSSKPISAEVILKQKNKKSFLKTELVTSQNIDDFLVDENIILKATEILKELGFNVFPSKTSISIVGQPFLFEKIFKMTLKINMDDLGNLSVNTNKIPPSIPLELQNYVEELIFPEAPEYF